MRGGDELTFSLLSSATLTSVPAGTRCNREMQEQEEPVMEPALEVDLSPEEMKEAEREVIQRQIETTEAQLEAMEKMEEDGAGGDMLDDATVQALKVKTIDQILSF